MMQRWNSERKRENKTRLTQDKTETSGSMCMFKLHVHLETARARWGCSHPSSLCSVVQTKCKDPDSLLLVQRSKFRSGFRKSRKFLCEVKENFNSREVGDLTGHLVWWREVFLRVTLNHEFRLTFIFFKWLQENMLSGGRKCSFIQFCDENRQHREKTEKPFMFNMSNFIRSYVTVHSSC